jgi:aminoglycoside 3-N-acetyltransferase
MVSYRDLSSGLKKLGIDPAQPVLVHASLSAFGEIRGGAETFLGALLAAYPRLMMPAFTFTSMVTPETGPQNNGLTYGSGKDLNRMAEFYYPDMPVDTLIGKLAQALLEHPDSQRSCHPILSFSGIQVADILKSQSIQEPFAPIEAIMSENGWVILAGVDHSVNTSIHYAEQLAGRKTFMRWALTVHGVVECPKFPGCSDGFTKAEAWFSSFSKTVKFEGAQISAIPLTKIIQTVKEHIQRDPKALLCSRKTCPRCDAVRQAIKKR